MSGKDEREESAAEEPAEAGSGADLEALEDLDEEEFEKRLEQDILEAQTVLASRTDAEVPGGSWDIAAEIVNRFRPVPVMIWVITHGVYGKTKTIVEPDPMVFSLVRNLILRAAEDKLLGNPSGAEKKKRGLISAVETIGSDVAASLCFIHALSRKTCSKLQERVWRPIIDDAFLRAQIGYHLGAASSQLSPGQGMLVGFAGRCGLAIQIASGRDDQAEKALVSLASGTEISSVCQKVYGCDPLQVAALALIAGGCSRDLAIGISTYSAAEKPKDREQLVWLTSFGVIESLRMGKGNAIKKEDWKVLALNDPSLKADIIQVVQTTLRRGHGWNWLAKPMSSMRQ